MKIVVPLGGVRRKFQECGHQRPKPLIRALSKEMLFWLLDSLKLVATKTMITGMRN